MSRRRVVQVSIVLVVVFVATLGTARARQVWSEGQAHDRMAAARTSTLAQIGQAARIGLLPSELAPLREQLRAVDGRRAPSSLPVWSAKRADFYDEQARAYARLRRAVRGTEGAVTVRTRQEAQSALGKLDGAITRAKSLDLDTTGAQHSRSVLSGTLRSSSLPTQYRSVVASADGAANSLATSIQSRQDYVNGVLRSAGNHEDAVLAGIDREVSAATDQMGLLGLLTDRVKEYRTTLADLSAAAHKQPTAFGAAVKEWSVHQAVAQVAADYAKTIPDRMIVVSTENQSAQMYEKGRQVYSTPVTTGGPELPTDHGVFHIYLKLSPFTFHSPWPVGSPYYYPPTPVTYWMPFDGAQGLHDASWRTDFGPGSNFAPTDLGTGNYILGTHGCVNLPMDAATFVWNWAPVGTTVVVV